ncbi:MAG: hypothetical protein SFZ24_11430 [Planctomycetota bacterium]|nr:hypothetical protein [Planctomycetota bacterium]
MPHDDSRPPAGAAVSHEELLRRIHDAVTANQRSGPLQALIAVTLSLATLGSTWCGYQAAQWSSRQSTLQSHADTAEREAAENTLAGLQIRTQDGLLVLEYWRARRTGEQQVVANLLAHMRPELRQGLEASVREGILENPAVKGPMQREEYALEVESLARQQRDLSRQASAQADRADSVSDRYVLVTLLLASTLFVGGISTTFSRPLICRALGLVAAAVFTVALINICTLPVFWPSSAALVPTAPPRPAP